MLAQIVLTGEDVITMCERRLLFPLVIALAALVLLSPDVLGGPRGLDPGSGIGSRPTAAVTEQAPVSSSPVPGSDATPLPEAVTSDTTPYVSVAAWETRLDELGAVTIAPGGKIYVVDSSRNIVIIFNPDGSGAGVIDYSGLEPTDGPSNDIAVDDEGFIYILVSGRLPGVAKYSPDGRIVTFWSGDIGAGIAGFVTPTAIAVDDRGVVYVAERLFEYSARIQTFTNAGDHITEWTVAGDRVVPRVPVDMAVTGDAVRVLTAGDGSATPAAVVQFSGDGEAHGEPLEIQSADGPLPVGQASFAIGPDGTIFTVDPAKREVVELATDGDILSRWTIEGNTVHPGKELGIAVASDGRVVVVDVQRQLIEVFAPANGSVSASSEPVLTVSPESGMCGTRMTAYGRHFTPGATVSLVADVVGGGERVPVGEAVADDEGFFRAPLDLTPAIRDCTGDEVGLDGADLTIEAISDGEAAPTAVADVTLFSPAHHPTLTLDPDTHSCGDAVTVTGSNFQPGTRVSLAAGIPGGHTFVPVAEANAVNPDGTFTVEVDILPGDCPNLPPGVRLTYLVAATTVGAGENRAAPGYPSATAEFTFTSRTE